MKFSKLAIIIILIAVTTVFSGCGKIKPAVNKNVNDSQNSNTNLNQNSNTNLNSATTTDEIDTSDWQIYRDSEYGFSIKYPKGWKVDDKEAKNKHIVFIDPKSRVDFMGHVDYTQFSISVKKIDLDFDEYIENYKAELAEYIMVEPTVKTVRLLGFKGKLFIPYGDVEGPLMHSELFLQKNKDTLYRFYAKDSGDYDNILDNLFPAFYSSIKFLD